MRAATPVKSGSARDRRPRDLLEWTATYEVQSRCRHPQATLAVRWRRFGSNWKLSGAQRRKSGQARKERGANPAVHGHTSINAQPPR